MTGKMCIRDSLNKMAKAGFFGIKVPKQYGGQGGDARSYVIVMEEIARVSGVASKMCIRDSLYRCGNRRQIYG